jgi:lipopolysaccharide export system protein LptA
MPPIRSLATLAVLALAGFCSPAHAEEKPGAGPFGNFSLTSRKDPIQVTSDKLDFDYKKRRTVFRGSVEVIQGDVKLASDTLTVDYTEDDKQKQQQLKEVAAEGHVTITQGARKATGERATFDQTNRTLVLTGNAVLEEGSNQINGDTIVVYPDESRMEVKGENSRVKLIIFPGQGSLGQVGGPKPGETPRSGGTKDDGASQGP